MYNLTNTQKVVTMMKTTLGSILFALGIVAVHFIAWAVSTYAPVLSLILIAGFFTWLLIQIYIGVRDR